MHWTTNPGISRSNHSFFSFSNEHLNWGPVSVWSCFLGHKTIVHSLTHLTEELRHLNQHLQCIVRHRRYLEPFCLFNPIALRTAKTHRVLAVLSAVGLIRLMFQNLWVLLKLDRNWLLNKLFLCSVPCKPGILCIWKGLKLLLFNYVSVNPSTVNFWFLKQCSLKVIFFIIKNVVWTNFLFYYFQISVISNTDISK